MDFINGERQGTGDGNVRTVERKRIDMTKHFCNRCEKEVEREYPIEAGGIYSFREDSHYYYVFVCEECLIKAIDVLKVFMEK